MDKYFPNVPFIRSTVGHETNLVVRSAEAFKEIMIRQADAFPKPLEVYGVLDLFGSNIVTTNGDPWKIHRRVCEPAFSESHMKFLAEETAKSTELMFKRFGDKLITINAEKEMIDVTLDIIGKVNFGADLGIYTEVQYDSNVHTMSMRKALEITLSTGLLVRGVLPKWTNFLFPGTCRAVDEAGLYIRELIENKKNQSDRFDLLSLISTANQEALELSTNEMVADSFVFLFAGHETSATNLQWILYELAMHPEIQTKVFQQVSTVLKGRDPTYDDYQTLTYVNGVVQESLRLHPPVSLVPKVAKKDVIVTGQKIRKGTMVLMDLVSVQRSTQYWDEPLQFRPERFDSSISPKITPYAYAPFSLGARKCLGAHFSLVETCVILSMIVQKYEIKLPKGVDYSKKPIEEVQVVTIKPHDLHVDLVPRQ
jgi:cytochrome P450